MRLTDADLLKERLKVSPIFPDFGEDGFFIRDMVIDLVDNQRTVDAVEVVRCKDCKYYKKFKGFRGAWCHRWLRKESSKERTRNE